MTEDFFNHSKELASTCASEAHLEAIKYAGELAKANYEKQMKNLKDELDNNKTILLDFVRRFAEGKVENMKEQLEKNN
ncbi:5704_t:CDS:2 [Diversispora eburnea]|uniref:5704_t:CDS:1 n=1 Tax=Diversispora eburnea TaxID=1213867 RepID=A0A9N8Z5E2_9GLOM|nr:5704_t:CDS:2 [Diversispora eburnea]